MATGPTSRRWTVSARSELVVTFKAMEVVSTLVDEESIESLDPSWSLEEVDARLVPLPEPASLYNSLAAGAIREK